MRKSRPPSASAGDIPAWFMTYSDVITLLMTFFILLLTFASSEPEKFERMQVSLFGGGGATGIASKAEGPLEREALLLRVRPKASRITSRGTETPAIEKDPSYQSLNKGLESLDANPQHDPNLARAIEVSLPAMVIGNDELSVFGELVVKMLAQQLRKSRLLVKFEVASPQDVERAVMLCHKTALMAAVPMGRLGVGIRTDNPLDPSKVRIVVTTDWEQKRG